MRTQRISVPDGRPAILDCPGHPVVRAALCAHRALARELRLAASLGASSARRLTAPLAIAILLCLAALPAARSLEAQPFTMSLTDFVPNAQDMGHTRIAAAADGSVALAVEVKHGNEWKIAVQRYSPTMQPVGPLHFFVGCGIQWTSEYTEFPEIAFHPTGHLVVLAQQSGDYHLGGDSWNHSEVHIGLIDPQGQRIDTAPGSSDCVETFLYFDDGSETDRAQMDFTPNGELFATADGFFGDTNYRNVAFQVMDSELNDIEGLRQVIPHSDPESANALHWFPDIATNGSVVITTWHECPFVDNQGNYQDCDVRAQFVGINGASLQAIGENRTVNTGDSPTTMNVLASAAMDAAGNSVVVWIDDRPAPNGAVYGQRFNASGQPVGGNFQISAGQNPFPSTEQVGYFYLRPEVAMLSDGRFMVGWTEMVGSTLITAMGRRYSAAGVPLEPPVSLLGDGNVQTAFPHIDAAGSAYFSTWIGIVGEQGTLFVSTLGDPVAREDDSLPREVVLEANYPNPFNPSTLISFELPEAGPVRLTVYDQLGRQVMTLVDGVRPAGRHTVRLDSEGLPSGVYLYRLEAREFTQTRRATLLR